MVSLYQHQQDHVNRVRQALVSDRRVIMSAPPGTGKTRMAKHMLDRKLQAKAARQNGKALFCVHRRGLVENASDSFNESPELDHGVIMSGRETAFGYDLQVASIDTLNSWWCTEEGYKGYTFDLIVFDECHSHASKLQTFLKYHDAHRASEGLSTAFVLGLSATPQGDGLPDIFKSIVPGPEPRWLIEQGYLSPFRYFNGKKGKLDLLVKQGQRFTNDSVNAAMDGLSGDLVPDWKRLAEGRSTVGFFSCRSHAKEAQQILRNAGIDAEYVDGETPDDERRLMFRNLNNGLIDYICNVGVVERGTDIPRVGCVQLCTAIGSIVRYRQMIGRGSRVHEDVEDCLVIDHGENVKRHGFFDDPIEWTLDQKVTEAKDSAERPTIECPKCGRQYRGGKCSECEYEPTSRERKSQGLEFNGSQLVEVTKSKPRAVQSNEQIMVGALYAAGRSNRTWKQAIHIAFTTAKKQNVKFRVPKTVEIGGNRIDMVRYGSPDASRKVKDIYPFTVGAE